MKALIVDDDIEMHDLYKEVLSSNNFEAVTFDLPSEALQELSKNPSCFHLIVTDISLPQMDGYQFIHEVRELGIKTPIISVTGVFLSESDKHRVGGEGRSQPDFSITKPFTYGDFYDAIGTISHLIDYNAA